MFLDSKIKSSKFDISNETETSSAEDQLARDSLIKESKIAGSKSGIHYLTCPCLKKPKKIIFQQVSNFNTCPVNRGLAHDFSAIQLIWTDRNNKFP